MKLIIDVPKDKLLQVLVPEHIQKCEIVNYGYAGTAANGKQLKKFKCWGRCNYRWVIMKLSEE